MPGDIAERMLIVVDPMLATGGSASAALELLKQKGAKSMILMCLVSAPQGIRLVNQEHPDVPIYVAAIDDHLNEKGYIVPGLGPYLRYRVILTKTAVKPIIKTQQG